MATPTDGEPQSPNRSQVIERSHPKQGCYGWSYQDVYPDGSPADGFIYIQHGERDGECPCLPWARLDTLVEHAKAMASAGVFPQEALGEAMMIHKLNIGSKGSKGTKLAGHAAVPEADGYACEIADNTKVEEYGEWCLMETEAGTGKPWEAVLLPLRTDEPPEKLREMTERAKDPLGDCQPGDLVFIWPKKIKEGVRTKQVPVYMEEHVFGPYQVLNVFENSCSLDLPQNLSIFPIVDRSYLSKYTPGVLDMQAATPRVFKRSQWKANAFMDANVRTTERVTRTPKEIFDVEARKEYYYRAQVGSNQPGWFHSRFMEGSLDELNQFYAANSNALKPPFYLDYLESVKKQKQKQKEKEKEKQQRPGGLFHWHRKDT